MNAFTLAIASLRSRPMHSALCTAAVAAGIALLCAVFLLSQSVAAGFARNAQGIDVVVGTKGSPLQLVLSSVYHADIPAGNIPMHAYEEFEHHPHIRQAIPLALGDNFKGFRMVGTIPDYLNVYDAEFEDGQVFSSLFDVVAGADTGLKIDEKIAVTHSFSASGDDVHDDHLYTVTGVLKPSGTVLDKLLVTQVESVQRLHAGHHHEHDSDDHDGEEEGHDGHDHDDHDHAQHMEDHHEHDHDDHENQDDHAQHTDDHHQHDHDDHDDHEDHHVHDDEDAAHDAMHQITSVLLQLRSPADVMRLPRQINEDSHLQAAVPSYEMARFTKSLGIGRQLVVALGAGFVLLAGVMLWATLSSGLALRRYDLAVLRVLGATPRRLAATVLAEAFLIAGFGAVMGVVCGHLVAYGTVLSIDSLQGIVLPHAVLQPQIMDAGFILIGLLAGLLASLAPSLTAARTDIAALLAKGRV